MIKLVETVLVQDKKVFIIRNQSGQIESSTFDSSLVGELLLNPQNLETIKQKENEN